VGQVAGLKLPKKVPILGERDNALRWLRRWRERTINSAAPWPVDPSEELIHVACEAQEHVVLFEPERTPPTFVFTTKTGRQSPEGELYARSRFSPCSECAVSVPPS
jgi:hypothetical protein